jgi:hypothetical protein
VRTPTLERRSKNRKMTNGDDITRSSNLFNNRDENVIFNGMDGIHKIIDNSGDITRSSNLILDKDNNVIINGMDGIHKIIDNSGDITRSSTLINDKGIDYISFYIRIAVYS